MQKWIRKSSLLKITSSAYTEATLHSQIASEACSEAQKVYDAWEQDEEGIDDHYGAGGICDDIAESICEVINRKTTLECFVDYNEYDTHTSVFAYDYDNKRLFNVDIPPSVYETGGGYTWKKKNDVTFDRSDVVVEDRSRYWGDFEDSSYFD